MLENIKNNMKKLNAWSITWRLAFSIMVLGMALHALMILVTPPYAIWAVYLLLSLVVLLVGSVYAVWKYVFIEKDICGYDEFPFAAARMEDYDPEEHS